MFYKAHKEGAKIILVSTIITALLFILIDQFVVNMDSPYVGCPCFLCTDIAVF